MFPFETFLNGINVVQVIVDSFPSGCFIILVMRMCRRYKPSVDSSDHAADIGRKAHLLEDKQIPSVGVFDEVSFYTLFQGSMDLEAQFAKKQDKIVTLHDEGLKYPLQTMEMASGFHAKPSRL
ncbi:hypothetical protein Tco_0722415 [Tanacetum coccineum]